MIFSLFWSDKPFKCFFLLKVVEKRYVDISWLWQDIGGDGGIIKGVKKAQKYLKNDLFSKKSYFEGKFHLIRLPHSKWTGFNVITFNWLYILGRGWLVVVYLITLLVAWLFGFYFSLLSPRMLFFQFCSSTGQVIALFWYHFKSVVNVHHHSLWGQGGGH